VDTDGQRWARAMVRLQKELAGFSPEKRGRCLIRLRAGLPSLSSTETPTQWLEQLLALLLVMGEDVHVGSDGALEVPEIEWLRGWSPELAHFIPGYDFSANVALVEDSLEAAQVDGKATEDDRDLERLLRDEDEERQWKQAKEEHEAEELRMFEQEERRFLQREAEAYQVWEDEQLQASLSAMDRPVKRRCMLTLRAMEGSTGRPVAHTLAMEVPRDGTPLMLNLQVQMEDTPSEVPTVMVRPPATVAAVGSDSGTGSSGIAGPSATRSRPMDVTSTASPVLDFAAYTALYTRWMQKEISLEAVRQQYGGDTVDLLQAQYALELEIEGANPVVNVEPESGERGANATDMPEFVPAGDLDAQPLLVPVLAVWEMFDRWLRLGPDVTATARTSQEWLDIFRAMAAGGFARARPLMEHLVNWDALMDLPQEGRVFFAADTEFWSMYAEGQPREETGDDGGHDRGGDDTKSIRDAMN
ncbi:unnamed protein product, partial [Symbiodinium sp. CCMP2456]